MANVLGLLAQLIGNKPEQLGESGQSPIGLPGVQAKAGGIGEFGLIQQLLGGGGGKIPTNIDLLKKLLGGLNG